jgi:hypothetical protein
MGSHDGWDVYLKTKNSEIKTISERIYDTQKCAFIFFHPDYTVGFGISPNHALRLVGFTTGRDLHPALKILFN